MRSHHINPPTILIEQPSATSQHTQQHEASRGLSATAELLVTCISITQLIVGNLFLFNAMIYVAKAVDHGLAAAAAGHGLRYDEGRGLLLCPWPAT